MNMLTLSDTFFNDMNKIAKKQLQMLDPNISEQERSLREKEFYELYYELRRRDENSFMGKLSQKARKRLHPVLLLLYTAKNFLCGFRCEVIKDERIETDRPIIFAVTHVGKFDIENISVPLKDHYYLLSGDYEHLQGTFDAFFLSINGVLYFNEKVKADRVTVSNKMIEHLKAGDNLMYFPEGTWNLSPVLPMLPCYWGIVDIARKGGAVIIPVAVEQYGKRFKLNIGKNLDMQAFGSDPKEKTKAITTLRDILATLKWEIWESEPMEKRSTLRVDYWDKYISRRFKEWPFSMDYINGLIFKPKDITTSEEAFAHLKAIEPMRNNAYLFDKRHYF